MEEKKVTVSFTPKLTIIAVIIVVLLVAVVAGIVLFSMSGGQGENVTLVSKPTITKMLDISELNTVEYSYNGIAEAKNDKGETRYYVYYESKVKAGIEFDKVGIDLDEENKIIAVTIPPAKINSVDVDIRSLDFMFVKESNKEGLTSEAYSLCYDAVSDEAANEEKLLSTAADNAQTAVEALIAPWLATLDAQYVLKFV